MKLDNDYLQGLLAQGEEALAALRTDSSPLIHRAAADHLRYVAKMLKQYAESALPLYGALEEQRSLFWSGLPAEKIQKPASLVAFERELLGKTNKVNVNNDGISLLAPDANQADSSKVDPSGVHKIGGIAGEEAGIGSHESDPEFFAAFTEAEKTMIRREALSRQVSPTELLRDWILEFANPQD